MCGRLSLGTFSMHQTFYKVSLPSYLGLNPQLKNSGREFATMTMWLLRPQYLVYEVRGAISATRGLLATDHVIWNHGQVTWTTPELAHPLLTTTTHQREDVLALDRFNVHRCPTRRDFSGTGLELVTRQAAVRYLYHSSTAATS
ncbi:uncharacterized protein TNCV_977101 [Trichonephila clavipes]|nr:uncharacterized protein TNCV_977101 [Trichonephila clavipes]